MADIDQYFQVLGEAKLRDMVGAFYKRAKTDDILSPMYPKDDWKGAEDRLYHFLAMRLGGPRTYLEMRGHPRLRMRHFPYKIGIAERDRWVELMDSAMTEVQLEPDQQQALHDFFFQVADFLRNQTEKQL